jgi:CBS domain containing-hemolysin-like protein
MKRTHVKLKLVIDSNESFRGVITLGDLMSAKVVQAMEESGLSRFELTVKQVMTPKSALHAIDIRDFELASVGDIVSTMKKYGDQHVLVVDPKRASIRGIVSANEIARRMHAPVIIAERANSFSDIFKAVAG